MNRHYTYKIPRNMNHPDKVWSNGTHYISWFDVILSFAGILLIIALTYLVKNILVLVLSIFLIMLVCGGLVFWKPRGWPLYKIALLFLIDKMRPAVWGEGEKYAGKY